MKYRKKPVVIEAFRMTKPHHMDADTVNLFDTWEW